MPPMCVYARARNYSAEVISRIGRGGLLHRLSSALCRTMCSTSRWERKILISQKSIVDDVTDIDVEVSVIDTDENASNTKPVVVAIHGIPGRGDDFEPLISKLHKKGIRFISPTFLGFEGSLLKPWQLKHVCFSTQERSNFLQQLLNEMGISKVDMLLTHSAGTWLGYKILSEWDNVRSAGLLHPVGARPHKMIRPYPVVKSISTLLQIRPLLPIFLPLLSQIYNFIGFSGVTTGTHLYASQHLLANPDFHKVVDYAAKIAEKKIPLFIAHSENDKVLEWNIAKEMTKHLKIPPENIVSIDRNRNVSTDPLKVFAEDWLARVLLFESGGHIVHKPHSDMIVSQIVNILDYLD